MLHLQILLLLHREGGVTNHLCLVFLAHELALRQLLLYASCCRGLRASALVA